MAKLEMGETVSGLQSIVNVALQLRQVFFPLGGTFAGSEIKFTPIPEEVEKKSASEILMNPSPFPKLTR
jgi:hypothetical protein